MASQIIFNVNSHINKLFKKWEMIDYFIIVGVIMRRYDERETLVKENDGGR
jgi:hypothetical protein